MNPLVITVFLFPPCTVINSSNDLFHRDLSFNNLSGPLPKISARTFSIAGNSLICGVKSGDNCSSVSLDPLSYPPDDLKTQPQQGIARSHRIAIICGATVGSVALIVILAGMLSKYRMMKAFSMFYSTLNEVEVELFERMKKR